MHTSNIYFQAAHRITTPLRRRQQPHYRHQDKVGLTESLPEAACSQAWGLFLPRTKKNVPYTPISLEGAVLRRCRTHFRLQLPSTNLCGVFKSALMARIGPSEFQSGRCGTFSHCIQHMTLLRVVNGAFWRILSVKNHWKCSTRVPKVPKLTPGSDRMHTTSDV